MESHNYTTYTLAKTLHSKRNHSKAAEHKKTIKTFIKLTGLDKDTTTTAKQQTYLLRSKHPRPNKLRPENIPTHAHAHARPHACAQVHTNAHTHAHAPENTLTQLLNLHQAYQATTSPTLKNRIDQILDLQEGRPKSTRMTHSVEKSLNKKAKDKAPTKRGKTTKAKQNHKEDSWRPTPTRVRRILRTKHSESPTQIPKQALIGGERPPQTGPRPPM